MSDHDDLLRLALTTAEAAGSLLRERFRRPATGVESKSSATDPVSDADRDAEALIARSLREAVPDDAVLGEEGAERAGASGRRWIVDPLDGTVNYLYGIAQWAVSIACEDSEGLLLGVVHDPLAGETFSALRGHGAWLGEARLQVTSDAPLERALCGTGFSYNAEVRAEQARLLAAVLPRVRDLRRAGSAALDLAAVAAGRLDLFYEHGLQPWDLAAGELLVREAGGVVQVLAAEGVLPAGELAGGAAACAAMRPLLRSR